MGWFNHQPVNDPGGRGFVSGVLYAFIYFSTDQYIPSLPAMQLELKGSESLMTGALVPKSGKVGCGCFQIRAI